MNLKLITLALVFTLLPINAIAKDESKITCSKQFVCVDSSDFIAEVTKVRNRGTIAIVQIQFISKVKELNMKFNNGMTLNLHAYGYSTLVDTNGKEIKIDGSNISNFEKKQGEKQVVSFSFKSKDKKAITEPFDVTVKTKNYEITFFDLKSESRKEGKEAKITVPVMIGGDPEEDACSGVGEIKGIKRDGDGFIAVRSGPGKEYKIIDKIYRNGTSVAMCDSKGKWEGIVYGKENCGTGSSIAKKQPYEGKCKSGWVFGRYIQLIAD